MAQNNNNNNDNNDPPMGPKDWLGITIAEMKDEASPLGMIKDKPFNYFDFLTRNFVGNPNLFQVNLGQFPQNFLVVTGPTATVRIVHILISVNANPDSAASTGTVVGRFGTNKITPFKAMTATSAVLALTPPRRSSNKKEPEVLLPSIKQFKEVTGADEFAGIVGDAEGMPVNHLSKFPNAHFLHPQVFVDIEGKREWEAGKLGYHIISLYKGTPNDEDDSEDEDDEGGNEENEGRGLPKKLVEVDQLLIFLWAAAKQCGSSVTLREIPEVGEVTALRTRKASTLEPSLAKESAPHVGDEEAAA
jgi:hypothetical protein